MTADRPLRQILCAPWALCPALLLAVLICDLSVPLGVATSVAYVLPVLCCLFLGRIRCVVIAGVLGSGLTLLGLYLSPAAGDTALWKVAVNRLLSLLAIWATVLLGLTARRVERNLREADGELVRISERRHRLRQRQLEQRVRQADDHLSEAGSVQRRLYPESAPEVSGFEMAAEAFAAEQASGDYYDFIPGRDGGYVVALGDAMGHGMGAALLVAETQAYLRSLAASSPDPGELLARINELLATQLKEDGFVTLLLVRLDFAQRTLDFASAGQKGYLFRSGGQVEALGATGAPLGLLRRSRYALRRGISLECGDLLLLCSDGIEEARRADGGLFGERRIQEMVRTHRHAPAREIIRRLYRTAREFAAGEPQADDMTAVVVKILKECEDSPRTRPRAATRPGRTDSRLPVMPWLPGLPAAAPPRAEPAVSLQNLHPGAVAGE